MSVVRGIRVLRGDAVRDRDSARTVLRCSMYYRQTVQGKGIARSAVGALAMAIHGGSSPPYISVIILAVHPFHFSCVSGVVGGF